ncbi:ankyrin repeat-containing domain protein [Fusarium oxysporum II5]|nr:ankyrin repeat-containing domain protein [Fusarium oxysporum II5]
MHKPPPSARSYSCFLEGCVLFASPKQQETHRLRERNRTAKRASRARQRQREQHNDTTADVATAEATAQDVDVAPPLQPPQHPGSGSGSDSVCVRAEASEDLDVWALDGPLDDPTALPWPSSLDEDWPVSVPGICNPEPRAPPASSSSLTSNSNDFNSKSLRLLHIAARNGTTGILLSLIKAGADVNSRDCSGTTPLHIAVRFRRASALELLVSHGANMNARDSANMTALEGAVRAQDEHVNIPLSGGAELH